MLRHPSQVIRQIYARGVAQVVHVARDAQEGEQLHRGRVGGGAGEGDCRANGVRAKVHGRGRPHRRRPGEADVVAVDGAAGGAVAIHVRQLAADWAAEHPRRADARLPAHTRGEQEHEQDESRVGTPPGGDARPAGPGGPHWCRNALACPPIQGQPGGRRQRHAAPPVSGDDRPRDMGRARESLACCAADVARRVSVSHQCGPRGTKRVAITTRTTGDRFTRLAVGPTLSPCSHNTRLHTWAAAAALRLGGGT